MYKIFLIFLVFGAAVFADDPIVIIVPGSMGQKGHQADKTPVTEEHAAYNQGGTENFPVFVKVISPTESAKEAQEHAEDRANARKVANANIAYAFIAALQLIVLGVQCGQLWKTFKSGKQQGTALSDIVNEAQRSADSIGAGADNIRIAADAMRENAIMAKNMLAKQMRAYLHIDSGGALFQETEIPFRFEARPLLVNNGFTSARNIRFRIRAEIFPNPLPHDAVFREPYGVPDTWYIGPRQQISLPASVETLVPEGDIEIIKLGNQKRLYVWGVVTYDDINEGHQTLSFCLNYLWLKNGTQLGTFIGGRCDST